MTTTTPLREVLKHLPAALLHQDSIPVMGYPPPFPWNELTKRIAERFQIKDLKIAPEKQFTWFTPEELLKGIGEPSITLPFAIAPSGGMLWWAMSESDLLSLLSLVINPENGSVPFSADLQKGFTHFLALEVISILPELAFDKEISAQVVQKAEFPKTTCLGFNVSISLFDRTFWGRLIISPELQQQWKERYTRRTLEAPLAAHVDLIVQCVVGNTTMKLSEWSKVRSGDFLTLDQCLLETESSGKVAIMLDTFALFRGKLEKGTIKILESPLYQEVNLPMDTHDEPEEKENEDLHDLDEELEDEELEEDIEVEESGSDAESELKESESDTEAELEESDEIFSEEEGDEGEYTEEGAEHWPPPPEKRPEPKTDTVAAVPTKTPVESAKKEKEESKKADRLLATEDIPIAIAVEVARIQMSVQQLMELQPGNLLELGIHPENGVDLVVHGKCIAKGELLLIGETLGVRVLDIGQS